RRLLHQKEIDPLLLGKAPLLRRDEDRAVEEWEESGGDLIAHPFPPASRIEQADSQRQAAGNLDDLAVLVHGGPPQEGVCLLLRDPLRTHEYSLGAFDELALLERVARFLQFPSHARIGIEEADGHAE